MRNFLCDLAHYAGLFWDFIDKRQIDAQIVGYTILGCTVYLMWWAVDFAWNSPRPGSEVAMIIGAVMAPWSALQGAITHFYFKTRE